MNASVPRFLRIILPFLLGLPSARAASNPLAATGWTTDFVLGSGESYATHTKPVNANIWYAENSTVGAAGLPASGAVTVAGKDFQFQPFGGGVKNCLRGDNVTLTLVTPGTFGEISLLGSNPGSGGGSMVLQFADGSSTAVIPLNFAAWNRNTTGDISPGLTNNGTTKAFPGGMSVFTYLLSVADQSRTLNSILFGGGGGKTIFALSGGADVTPPTLSATGMVDDKSGGPVAVNIQVNYTVTFSEGMNAATVSAADFGNAGTSACNFGAVSEIASGVFNVEVTPTTAGTLRLQVPVGASMTDNSGNSLNIAQRPPRKGGRRMVPSIKSSIPSS